MISSMLIVRERKDKVVVHLRVAYEATALLGNRTGVGEFCFEALDALAMHDELDITAFAMSYRRRHLLKELLPEGVGYGDWIMPARPLHAVWKRSNLPPIEIWNRKIDVLHATNFVSPPTLKSAKVITVHDLTTLRFPEMCNPPTLIYPKMIQRAIDAGAFVHTPSEFVAAEVISSFRVDPGKVKAIHHGIPRLTSAVDLESGEVADLVGKQFVLSLGTIEPRKDLPLLVRAFDRVVAEFPDLYLVIAGQDGWGTSDLIDALAKVRAKGKVLRLGYVQSNTREWLLRNATVFAYPSVYEGFGFPPLEAMSLGTPVVSTRAGALSEVLSDDCAALVDTGDMEGFASGIKKVVSDSAYAQKLKAAARDHVRKFSWAKCANELAELYRQASSE